MAPGQGSFFTGFFKHSYLDSDTGASIEEPVLLQGSATASSNGVLLGIYETTITITYTGGATQVLLSCTSTGSAWSVDIQEDGTSLSGWPKTYGTGVGTSAGTLLSQLLTDISAETNYGATASPSTGAEGGTGIFPTLEDYDITSGGSFKVFIGKDEKDTGNQTDGSMSPTLAVQDVGFRNAIGVNMNDILYVAHSSDYLYKYDGLRFYRAGVPKPQATCFALATATAGNPNGTYTYYYTYRYRDARGQFVRSALSPLVDFEPTSRWGVNPDTSPSASTGGAVTVSSKKISVYVPNFSSGKIAGVVSTGTASNVTHPFLDDLQFDVKVGDTLRVLNNGVAETRTVADVTYTFGSKTITLDSAVVSTQYDTWFHIEDRFNVNHAIQSGGQTGVSDGEIDVDSGHGVLVGDVVYFYDSDNDYYIERTVTAVGSTTVTINDEGATFGIADDDIISTGARIEIWRNKNGGIQLYKVDEIPATDANNTFTLYTDDKSDGELVEKYVPPARTPFPPPKCSSLVSFQGVLMTAGDFNQPNTIQWSFIDDPESFSPAFYIADVPFTTKGNIRGFGETQGYLYIFKDESRAILYGDLPSGSIRIEPFDDGIGCPSPHSIQSTANGLIWLSRQGPRRAIGPNLDPRFHLRLKRVFENQFYEQEDSVAITTAQQSQFVFARAQSVDDVEKNLYILFVPCESGTPGGANVYSRYPNDNGQWWVFDYANEEWFEWTKPSGINAQGGMILFRGQMTFASWVNGSSSSVFTHLFRQMSPLEVEDDKHMFADNVSAITQKIITGWEHNGEPSTEKHMTWLKTWQINAPNPVGHTLTVKTYRDWSTSSAHSSFTQDYSSTSTIKKATKAKSGKAEAWAVEISNATLYEAFFLSGLQVAVRLDQMEKVDKG